MRGTGSWPKPRARWARCWRRRTGTPRRSRCSPAPTSSSWRSATPPGTRVLSDPGDAFVDAANPTNTIRLFAAAADSGLYELVIPAAGDPGTWTGGIHATVTDANGVSFDTMTGYAGLTTVPIPPTETFLSFFIVGQSNTRIGVEEERLFEHIGQSMADAWGWLDHASPLGAGSTIDTDSFTTPTSMVAATSRSVWLGSRSNTLFERRLNAAAATWINHGAPAPLNFCAPFTPPMTWRPKKYSVAPALLTIDVLRKTLDLRAEVTDSK